MKQIDEQGRIDLVAAISAALKIADSEERSLIGALLQHALELARKEDAAAIPAPRDP